MIQDKIFFDEKDPTGLNYNTPFTVFGSYEGRLWSKAPGGEIKYYTQNSDLSVFATTGSNQFEGNQAITGSLVVTGGITGTATTASHVTYANVANKPTLVSGSSQVSFTGIINKPTLVSGSSQVSYSGITNKPTLVSSSVQVLNYGVFATTGSNGFNGSQSITGSLTVTGAIVAQTLNVQQVTSSVVFSSGSNVFGNSLGNTQQFTGSVSITGSLNTSITAFGSAATTFLTSDSGTIRSRTAAQTLSDIAALPLAGGTLTGPLTGSSAVFSGALQAGAISSFFSGGAGTAGQIRLGYDSTAFWQIGRLDPAGAGSGNFQFKPNAGTSVFDITTTGAATFSSSVTATNLLLSTINSITVSAGSNIINSTYSGTNGNWLTIQNAGGILYAGLENSASTTFGATAYAGVLYLTGARNFEIFTSSAKRLTIASTGAATFSSSVKATTYEFTGAIPATAASTGYIDYSGGGSRIFSVGTSGATKGTFSFIAKGADDSSIIPLSLASTGAATFSSSVTATTGNGNSLNLRSGNAGQYTIFGLGRTSQDLAIASAANSGQFFTGAVAGDAWFGSTNGTIGLGNDTSGVATMVIKGGNVGIGISPDFKLDVNGVAQIRDTLSVTKQVGKFYVQTSASGTTSFVNTGIFYNTSIIGFSNNGTYLLSVTGNPNGAGSDQYRAVYIGYITVTTGYDFGISSVVQRISYTQIVTADAFNIGALTVTVVFWNGSTETTQQVNGTTNNQIRVKITGYNSGNIGAAQDVRITKIVD